jgi:hypothetical protein
MSFFFAYLVNFSALPLRSFPEVCLILFMAVRFWLQFHFVFSELGLNSAIRALIHNFAGVPFRIYTSPL